MAKVVDHYPLIHPVRNASELVKLSLPQRFLEISLSRWHPEWVKHVLKGISKDEYLGLVVPEIRLAAFYTNSLLKSAGAYHELNGHIKTLISNGDSRLCSLVYHASLMDFLFSGNESWLGHSINAMTIVVGETVTQEILANNSEIRALVPYVRHEYLGNIAKKRINYLRDLAKEKTWFCDMLAGPICTHRRAMFLHDLLCHEANLPIDLVAELLHGFAVAEERHNRSLTILADRMVLDLAGHIDEIKGCGKEEIVQIMSPKVRKADFCKEYIIGGRRVFTGFPYQTRDYKIDKAFFVDSQEHYFEEGARDYLADVREEERRWIAEVFKIPLCNLVSRSFVVATKRGISLFVDRQSIPEEERLKHLSLEILKNLKALTIQTYETLNQSVQVNWMGCPLRSGSQCLFREQLGYLKVKARPTLTVHWDKVRNVSQSLLHDRYVISIFNKIQKLMMKLTRLNSKGEM